MSMKAIFGDTTRDTGAVAIMPEAMSGDEATRDIICGREKSNGSQQAAARRSEEEELQ